MEAIAHRSAKMLAPPWSDIIPERGIGVRDRITDSAMTL